MSNWFPTFLHLLQHILASSLKLGFAHPGSVYCVAYETRDGVEPRRWEEQGGDTLKPQVHTVPCSHWDDDADCPFKLLRFMSAQKNCLTVSCCCTLTCTYTTVLYAYSSHFCVWLFVSLFSIIINILSYLCFFGQTLVQVLGLSPTLWKNAHEMHWQLSLLKAWLQMIVCLSVWPCDKLVTTLFTCNRHVGQPGTAAALLKCGCVTSLISFLCDQHFLYCFSNQLWNRTDLCRVKTCLFLSVSSSLFSFWPKFDPLNINKNNHQTLQLV